MVLSRDMQGRFTRNCCRLVRKLGGTVCSPLQTRFRPPFFLALSTKLTSSSVFGLPSQSSSFLGPLIVGLIADMTGNIRYAFFFLVVMIWLAVPVLMSVDVQKGREDARVYDYRGSREANGV